MKKVTPWFFLGPFLAFYVFTVIIPVIMAVGYSFGRIERDGVFGEQGARQAFAGLDNYVAALSDQAFLMSFGRMLLFGVVQVPIMIVAVTILALILESSKARFPEFFRAAYFLPYGVPGVIAAILWSFLYIPGLSPIVAGLEALGLSVDFLAPETVLWSIANIVVWNMAGYNMLIIIAQLKAIPGEIYEAAQLDGAGPLRVALAIQVPLIRPALMLTVIFSIIGTLQLFAEPNILRTLSAGIDSKYTPNLTAYTYAFQYDEVGLAAAQAVIIAVFGFVLSLIALRLMGGKK